MILFSYHLFVVKSFSTRNNIYSKIRGYISKMQKNILDEITPFLDQYSDDPDFISAFARGLIIFETLSRCKKPQTMSDISKMTGFPRASVRRGLYTLIQLGYVRQDERYYELTSKILRLAHDYITSQNLPSAAQPILEDITKQLDEASSMAVLVQNEIIYIARSSENTQRIMSNTLTVGSHLPAYCTSMGRVLLAAESVENQLEILNLTNIRKHTEHTVTDINELLKIFSDVKEQGYSLVYQELEIELCSIAVPVFDKTGKVIASINVSTHALRNSPQEVKERFLPTLQKSATILATFL